MALYFFILGNHPALSVAEIQTVAKTKGLSTRSFPFISNEACILDSHEVIDVHSWQKQLGGTIKIGTILGTQSERDLNQITLSNWCKPFLSSEKKNVIGISSHGIDLPKNAAIAVKMTLKKAGFSIRVLENKTPALTSVQVGTQQLLTKGLELVLIFTGNTVFVGKTESIQDYESYGERDFGRPGRDDRSGMLPPKLARMMLNLGQVTTQTTLLDPFCGSGTIVTEALDLGLQTIFASDISEQAIEDTEKNVNWFVTNYISNANVLVQKHDATQPFSIRGADVVVSELFLGPPRMPRGDAFQKIKKEIELLFTRALQSIAALKNQPKRIVLAIPRFSVNERWEEIDISNAQRVGYAVEKPLSRELQQQFAQQLSSRGNLVYARPTATVGREILLLSR